MKTNSFYMIILIILSLIILSCDNTNDPSGSDFEVIIQLNNKNVQVLQCNNSNNLLLACPGDSIYYYNTYDNVLTSKIDFRNLWSFSKNKLSIDNSIILSYFRDSLQIFKSLDDGKSFSKLHINGAKQNTTEPIISGNMFYLKDNGLKVIYVLDKDFILKDEITINVGEFKNIYPWFDSKILIKKNINSIDNWVIFDNISKIETEIHFNFPGKLTELLLINQNNIFAYDIYSSKIYKSINLGKNFTEITNVPGTIIHDLKILNSSLYIATDKGIFTSSDFGLSWKNVFTNSEEPISFDINQLNKLFIVTDAGKVYKEK